MYHYCVPLRKHFWQVQKYPSHSVSSTHQTNGLFKPGHHLWERRENMVEKSNEIFIREPKFRHSWKCAARENLLIPLEVRLFCNNKYLYLQKSFNFKTDVAGRERKRHADCTGCREGSVNLASSFSCACIAYQYILLLPHQFLEPEPFKKTLKRLEVNIFRVLDAKEFYSEVTFNFFSENQHDIAFPWSSEVEWWAWKYLLIYPKKKSIIIFQ